MGDEVQGNPNRTAGGVNELAIALSAVGRAISFIKIFESRSAAKPGELAACQNALSFLTTFYAALDPSREMEYLSVVAAVLMRIVSHRPIQDASPVDFKLHHYQLKPQSWRYLRRVVGVNIAISLTTRPDPQLV